MCKGIKTTSKGSKYSGEFKDGKYHGKGTIINAAGDKYIGGWNKGKFFGEGTLTRSNGDKKSGIWKDGKLYKKDTLSASNKEKKISESLSDSDINKVINKITKGDGMKNIDFKNAMNQLKLSGIDIDMDLEQLKKYLNSKEFLEKIKKEFEKIKNR